MSSPLVGGGSILSEVGLARALEVIGARPTLMPVFARWEPRFSRRSRRPYTPSGSPTSAAEEPAGRVSEGGGTASPPDYLTVKRPPVGGRRFSCGSEGTRARAAPPSRWSRASPAAACSRAPRRAACGCGRNDTRTGLRGHHSHSTSSRSTPTSRLDYASSVALPHGCEAVFCAARSQGVAPVSPQEMSNAW
jgi:hypothetical protein